MAPPACVFKYVVKAAKCLNDGKGGTPDEIYDYIREKNCVRMIDKDLKCAIKECLKKGCVKGCFGKDKCSGRFFIKCEKLCCPPSSSTKPSSSSKSSCKEEEEKEEEDDCESSSSSSEEECSSK